MRNTADGRRGPLLARPSWRRRLAAGAALLPLALAGCTAISNPVANGVPVRRLPPELLAESKEDKRTIPLQSLRQKRPDEYILGPRDVLGIWIEGVLGERDQLPPLTPSTGERLPPSLGLPIPVQDDGTVVLPYVEPVKVSGLTRAQAEAAIREAYTVKRRILVPGRERIIVTLQRPRQYHVLVIRQDSGGVTVGSTGLLGSTKRGTGITLDLPAYENDVLNALAKSGGLPGLDALNEVIVERGAFTSSQEAELLMRQCEGGAHRPDLATAGPGRSIVRIPLRVRPGDPLPFRPDDVILRDGDIVFIEERDLEVWYAGGLLTGATHVLPRDRDLDALQAIAEAGFPVLTNGIVGNNLSGNIFATGAGSPSPSLLTVLRRTAGGGQVAIRVDINRALRDPNERLLIKSGDFVILQERPDEAFTRYLLQKLTVNINWEFLHGRHESGTFNATTP